MTGEISYDLVMDGDMDFVEGAFRLPGRAWQVVVVSKRPVSSPEVNPATWDGGVSGVVVAYPREWKLDRSAVEELLGRAFGVEARGPDSMQLR